MVLMIAQARSHAMRRSSLHDIILSAALEIVKISLKLNGYDDTGADIRIVTRQ